MNPLGHIQNASSILDIESIDVGLDDFDLGITVVEIHVEADKTIQERILWFVDASVLYGVRGSESPSESTPYARAS